MNRGRLHIRTTTYPIDKNDFGFMADSEAIKFDFAYITIHGTPGEDGTLQGYFGHVGHPVLKQWSIVLGVDF